MRHWAILTRNNATIWLGDVNFVKWKESASLTLVKKEMGLPVDSGFVVEKNSYRATQP